MQAELETGERETTAEEARAHIVVRIARISLGLTITALGIAMLVLPGPGFVAIAGGLFILAKDIAWADRLLTKMRNRVPGIPADGKIPRSQMVTMGVITAGAMAAALWLSTVF